MISFDMILENNSFCKDLWIILNHYTFKAFVWHAHTVITLLVGHMRRGSHALGGQPMGHPSFSWKTNVCVPKVL
jgi:hypothetical protein